MKLPKLSMLLLAVPVVIISCKKTDIPTDVMDDTSSNGVINGFPSDRTSINGYLYASVNQINTNNNNLVTYAVFGDPARNLMTNFNHVTEVMSSNTATYNPDRGNIRIGPYLTFSGFTLNQSASSTAWAYYGYNSISNPSVVASWKYDGNRSFKASDFYLPRNFPIVIDTLIKNFDTLKISQGYNVVTSGGRITNYDSLVINLISYTTPTVQVRKSFGGGATVTIPSADLAVFNNKNNVTFNMKAYNYSYQVSQGKTLVYELAKATQNKFLIVAP